MTCWRSVLATVVSVAALVALAGCGDDADSQQGPQEALLVVSPHPDDESNHVEDVSDLTAVRHDALAQHVSQVIGYPALCMPVYIPAFYTRWMQKVEEPFYEEVL